MCCKRCLAFILLLFIGIACGKKGDPLPPLRTVPQAVRDLSVEQQGNLLLLQMGYPALTTSGLALGGADSVTLLQLIKPAIDGEPALVPDAEFQAAAKEILNLSGAELGATVTGDRLQIKLPVAVPEADDAQTHTYAVLVRKADEISSPSNRVQIVPLPPPTPPASLGLDAAPEGVQLEWEVEGEDPEAFEIYRRQASERGYHTPIATVKGDLRRYFDRDARFGNRYIYTVRTVASKEPRILSGEATEREVDYRDRFAPPLPKNLVALGERGAIRLRWDPSSADDVAGYVVYRKERGRPFRQLTAKPISDLEYLDTGLAAGVRFEYQLQVIDTTGNESGNSTSVAATVR